MNRLASVLLLAAAHAAQAVCTTQAACQECSGTFDESSCKCVCGFTRIEALMIAYVGFVGVLMLQFH
jgi:hypothetical protein